MNRKPNPDGTPTKVSDIELFTKIWTSPRVIFRFIHDQQYDRFLYPLFAFAGIVSGFNRAISKDMGDSMSLSAIIGISVVFGGLLGWVSYYIYAGLISWTGGWLKGKATTRELFRILAYAMFPAILSLFLLIPQIALFGKELFKSDGYLGGESIFTYILTAGFYFIDLVLGIWTFVLFLIGVFEIQGFSIGKAFLNLLLPIFIIFLPLAILAGIFML